jgi:hypothetical protein
MNKKIIIFIIFSSIILLLYLNYKTNVETENLKKKYNSLVIAVGETFKNINIVLMQQNDNIKQLNEVRMDINHMNNKYIKFQENNIMVDSESSMCNPHQEYVDQESVDQESITEDQESITEDHESNIIIDDVRVNQSLDIKEYNTISSYKSPKMHDSLIGKSSLTSEVFDGTPSFTSEALEGKPSLTSEEDDINIIINTKSLQKESPIIKIIDDNKNYYQKQKRNIKNPIASNSGKLLNDLRNRLGKKVKVLNAKDELV